MHIRDGALGPLAMGVEWECKCGANMCATRGWWWEGRNGGEGDEMTDVAAEGVVLNMVSTAIKGKVVVHEGPPSSDVQNGALSSCARPMGALLGVRGGHVRNAQAASHHQEGPDEGPV
jgi:hypothetical protein